MRKTLTHMLLVAATLAMVGGCASEEARDLNSRLTSLERVSKKLPDATYIVDAPDSIRVEFLNEPSATREVTLRSDGCITLPYIEDVQVSRLTTIQIREKLEKAYEKYYKEPRILVTVTGYRSKRIYVYGEVGRQGTMPYTGSQTVMDIIGDSGGFTSRASYSRVQVIRGDPSDPKVFKLDVWKLVYEGDTSEDVSLAENDVVRVPPNWWAWVGYRINNVLWPFQSLWGAVQTGMAVNNMNQTLR